jgi:DNA modification methylase
MSKIPIHIIKVSEERARKTFDNIDKLAISIQEYGLIEPVVVDREHNLIAGERRLRACQLLEWKEIEVFYVEELDEWRKRAMELEENIQREDLTFAEECEAKLRLHELYQEKYGKTVERKKGGWGVDETAELLGDSVGETTQDLALARAIRENPKLAEKETKSAAYKAMKAGDELELRKKIAQILADDAPREERIKIVLGDARQVLKGYDDESFDFCVTDPPYGVNLDDERRLQFREAWGEVRVDSTRDLLMQEEIFKEVYRVLRKGGHCYVFFASLMQQQTLEMLVQCGFSVREIPLIWHKTKSLNLNIYTSFSNAFESIFFCHKDKPKIFNFPGLEDVFTYTTPHNKVHPTEKPLDLIRQLIENCSVENEIGIDPFAGSGTFGVACRQLNRRCVMVEIDEGYYTECWKRVEMEGGETDGVQTIEGSTGSSEEESAIVEGK